MTKTTRVMIDIETLGTDPGAAILSVGAVYFDTEDTYAEFHRSISLESCQEHGLEIDADTLEWWLGQDDDVARVLRGGEPLPNVLTALSTFCADAEEVWAFSPAFDCVLLEAAYAAVGDDEPWSHKDTRDCRTLAALSVWPDVQREGPAHDALADAIYQAAQTGVALAGLDE